MAGGMTQILEHLPSKHKALSLNPSTTKKKKEVGQPPVAHAYILSYLRGWDGSKPAQAKSSLVPSSK
jgi:hypothetical protein